MQTTFKKDLLAIIVCTSLLASAGTYVGQADALPIKFIPIPVEGTINPADYPIGITCDDPDFIDGTIFEQGQIFRVNKKDTTDVVLINDPETFGGDFILQQTGQGFYSIARHSATGKLAVNEVANGKLWLFDPSTPDATTNPDAWTRIVLVPEIVNELVTYPSTYQSLPTLFQIDESSGGGDPVTIVELGASSKAGVVSTNGFIWVGLSFSFDFDDIANSLGVDDMTFSGIVRVDPVTLEQTPISLKDINGIPIPSFSIAGLNIDSIDPSIIWVTDRGFAKVHQFDTDTLTVLQTIDLEPGTEPNHVATSNDKIFVALNTPGGDNDGDGFADSDSQIARFNYDRTTQVITPLDPLHTQAPNTNFGTFTVFVEGDVLAWTDQSGHIGMFDLTVVPPEPIPDEVTGELFRTTGEFDQNHFGCDPKINPIDFEFWVASRGSAKVAIVPTSKFSVGGTRKVTGHGGGGVSGGAGFAFGDPNSSTYDNTPPTIGKVLTESGSLKVSAEILDNVAVKDSNLIVGKTAYPMKQHDGNPVWWEGIVPSSDLPGSGSSVSFKIVARDFNNNIAEYSGSAEVPAGALTSGGGASLVITPAGMIGQQTDPTYSIVATGVSPDTSASDISPQITIKNTGTEPLKNIRLVLSPELRGKFLLSDYAIKSIAPKSETAVTLKLNGNPNVNAMKEPIPYDGQIIVTVDNHSPIVLKLSGNIPNDSSSLQSLFMKMVASKAEQRYRNFIPDERISQNADYQVTLGSGESMIKSASDELIITNNGEKPLKNLRIITSSIGDQFLPDQKNIPLIPGGSFVKVKLTSKMSNAESPRDLQGELLVVPENGAPVTIPINIGKKLLEDKNAMYEIRTVSGNDAISNTADQIVIRNNSKDTIDNVRIILPRELARVLSLSEDSFKSIEPNAEKIVYMQPRGTLDSKVKQILNDYTGDMIIVSSDGMKKVIPVNIVWKGISSEHFVIYARDNADELAKATQVINFLEHSYADVTTMIDKPITKTVIYMTGSLDELKMISDALAPSTFVYNEDVGFVWSNSEDVNMLALKEFAHRTIVQNYASYWTKQKISADKGNWLVDGVSNYVTARIIGERGMIKQELDAFVAEPASFEWYGAATPSQYGATYTLFKFLAEKYGDSIIDKTLSYLGSTMVSNHKCDTLEQCALLRAVYDADGLNINDKRNDLSFATIMQEWKHYTEDNYSGSKVSET